MKILHIIGSLDKSAGGPSRSVPQTCIELAQLGIQVEIFCRPSKDPVSVNETKNFQVRFLSIRELYIYGRNLNPGDFDLIHLQHIWDPYIHVMALAARIKGIPYIITPRGMLEPWIMARHPWKKKLAMALYQRKDLHEAALIHATATMEMESIRKLGFINEIAMIPNGIDLSRVPAPKTEYGSKKVVFLSRIHPKKGIELLLDAWKQLNKDGWSLEVTGNGEASYVKFLEKKIEKNKIQNAKILGPLYGDSKWDFIKGADIFVLPTYSENFGIVVAEALAVGVPVITTTGAPWHELLSHKCGWWIDLSVANLKESLDEAMSLSQSQLIEMGINGQRLIKSQYSVVEVAKKLVKKYEKIISESN
nr:glycosyltransferase [uncultured Draconibacterium sp.]